MSGTGLCCQCVSGAAPILEHLPSTRVLASWGVRVQQNDCPSACDEFTRIVTNERRFNLLRLVSKPHDHEVWPGWFCLVVLYLGCGVPQSSMPVCCAAALTLHSFGVSPFLCRADDLIVRPSVQGLD